MERARRAREREDAELAAPSVSFLLGGVAIALVLFAPIDLALHPRLPGIALSDALFGALLLALFGAWRLGRIPRAWANGVASAVAIAAVASNVVSATTLELAHEDASFVTFNLALAAIAVGGIVLSWRAFATAAAATLVGGTIEVALSNGRGALPFASTLIALLAAALMLRSRMGALRARQVAEQARADAAAAAARSERLALMTTLVSAVAHEVNNPLTYMGGGVEATAARLEDLAKDASLTHPQQEAVREALDALVPVRSGVERVARLTEGLVILAGDGSAVAGRAVDVSRVVTSALVLAQMRVPPRIGLESECHARREVPCDPRDLAQLVLLLVQSAAESLGRAAGAHIWVRTTDAPGGSVLLEVSDDATRPNEPSDADRTLRHAAEFAQMHFGALAIAPRAPRGTVRRVRIGPLPTG